MSTTRFGLAACLAACLTGLMFAAARPAAAAPLTFGPPLRQSVRTPDDAYERLGDEGFTAAQTDTGMTLVGDFNVRLRNSAAPGARTLVYVYGEQAVAVGDLPVMVSMDVSADFKVAVGGGTPEAPAANIRAGARLRQGDLFMNPSTEYIPGAEAYVSVTQDGNGYQLFSGDATGGTDYVLASRTTYVLELGVFVDAPSNPPGPESVVTVEFGGITAFEGFEVVVHATPVPEPAAAAGAALFLAPLAALRRRRRRRTPA